MVVFWGSVPDQLIGYQSRCMHLHSPIARIESSKAEYLVPNVLCTELLYDLGLRGERVSRKCPLTNSCRKSCAPENSRYFPETRWWLTSSNNKNQNFFERNGEDWRGLSILSARLESDVRFINHPRWDLWGSSLSYTRSACKRAPVKNWALCLEARIFWHKCGHRRTISEIDG